MVRRSFLPEDDRQAAAGGTTPSLAEQYAAAKNTTDTGDTIPNYQVGGNNITYWENVEFDPAGVLGNLQSQIYAGLAVRAGQFGWTQSTLNQLMEGIWGTNDFGSFLDNIWGGAQAEADQFRKISGVGGYAEEAMRAEATEKQLMGAHYYTQTQAGFMELTTRVWDFFNQKTAADLGAYPTADLTRGGGGGGGGGGLSAEDIRNQFDIDQLAEAASNIWRGMLLTDDADTRGMAKAYVEAVVAGKGEKKIDFTEFIRGKAKKTGRYASIYRNKPESMSEEQYLSPYFQSAMQVARPGKADEIAIQGAQFGASASAFAARLKRSEAATSSAPFMQDLQRRLTDINEVFRG